MQTTCFPLSTHFFNSHCLPAFPNKHHPSSVLPQSRDNCYKDHIKHSSFSHILMPSQLSSLNTQVLPLNHYFGFLSARLAYKLIEQILGLEGRSSFANKRCLLVGFSFLTANFHECKVVAQEEPVSSKEPQPLIH